MKTDSTLMLANLTSRVFRQLMRMKTEEAGLNETYRPFMMILSKENNINQLELAKRIHFSAPSISLTLQKMEADGLIVKTTSSSDKRNTLISLTEKGKIYNEKFLKVLLEVEEEIFKDISLEERDRANVTLIKLIKKITDLGGIPHEDI